MSLARLLGPILVLSLLFPASSWAQQSCANVFLLKPMDFCGFACGYKTKVKLPNPGQPITQFTAVDSSNLKTVAFYESSGGGETTKNRLYRLKPYVGQVAVTELPTNFCRIATDQITPLKIYLKGEKIFVTNETSNDSDALAMLSGQKQVEQIEFYDFKTREHRIYKARKKMGLFARNDKYLVWTSSSRNIETLDQETGVHRTYTVPGGIKEITLSKQGGFFVVRPENLEAEFQVFDLSSKDNQPMFKFRSPRTRIYDISSDGKYIATFQWQGKEAQTSDGDLKISSFESAQVGALQMTGLKEIFSKKVSAANAEFIMSNSLVELQYFEEKAAAQAPQNPSPFPADGLGFNREVKVAIFDIKSQLVQVVDTVDPLFSEHRLSKNRHIRILSDKEKKVITYFDRRSGKKYEMSWEKIWDDLELPTDFSKTDFLVQIGHDFPTAIFEKAPQIIMNFSTFSGQAFVANNVSYKIDFTRQKAQVIELGPMGDNFLAVFNDDMKIISQYDIDGARVELIDLRALNRLKDKKNPFSDFQSQAGFSNDFSKEQVLQGLKLLLDQQQLNYDTLGTTLAPFLEQGLYHQDPVLALRSALWMSVHSPLALNNLIRQRPDFMSSLLKLSKKQIREVRQTISTPEAQEIFINFVLDLFKKNPRLDVKALRLLYPISDWVKDEDKLTSMVDDLSTSLSETAKGEPLLADLSDYLRFKLIKETVRRYLGIPSEKISDVALIPNSDRTIGKILIYGNLPLGSTQPNSFGIAIRLAAEIPYNKPAKKVLSWSFNGKKLQAEVNFKPLTGVNAKPIDQEKPNYSELLADKVLSGAVLVGSNLAGDGFTRDLANEYIEYYKNKGFKFQKLDLKGTSLVKYLLKLVQEGRVDYLVREGHSEINQEVLISMWNKMDIMYGKRKGKQFSEEVFIPLLSDKESEDSRKDNVQISYADLGEAMRSRKKIDSDLVFVAGQCMGFCALPLFIQLTSASGFVPVGSKDLLDTFTNQNKKSAMYDLLEGIRNLKNYKDMSSSEAEAKFIYPNDVEYQQQIKDLVVLPAQIRIKRNYKVGEE